MCVCVSQLKKTAEELNDALAAKEEISQRCRELDMQVSLSSLTWMCSVSWPKLDPMFIFLFVCFFKLVPLSGLKPEALL